ncbi:MAG: 5-formyltetrahydrofolate cyclo-ligase [Firmicutes bacterium CAG:552_39_19]|nr:MAG: 5-formyltetrahydrofolate cyclo-ligase [Firmicutes bacterium CAG:552_39_19]
MRQIDGYKEILRTKFKDIRKNIAEREQKEIAVAEKLEPMLELFDSVFCYVSMSSELSTKALIQKISHKVYIPYTCGDDMVCRKYVGGELVADKLGNVNDLCYGDIISNPAVTVVPMLAFDKDCFRLGYGGGYYDRFLSTVRTMSIGIAFDEQLSEDNFANSLMDVPLDIIITPQKIFRRKL